ncbi:single-strand DNA-binding protein [Micromonospora carbonacea subsp. aurantiaca]|nr:single-strand DNA-binding protein [Micromonospora carbonacea]
MFDTHVTIVGNILTAPEWRRTTQSGTLVANFKVASTARRLDRGSGRWVDGNSLRVRVNCWRKLAEGVAASVMVGDPVVVVGRLYTRDWTDDAGNHRTVYELEAVAVGHDLSRGRARFLRNRPNVATSTVEDAEAESRVHGEPTERVPREQAPSGPPLSGPEGRPFDEDFEPDDFVPAHVSFDPRVVDAAHGPAAAHGLGAAPGLGAVHRLGDAPRGLDDLDERDDLDDDSEGDSDEDDFGHDDSGHDGLGDDGGRGQGSGLDAGSGFGAGTGEGSGLGDDGESAEAGAADGGPPPSGGALVPPAERDESSVGRDGLSVGRDQSSVGHREASAGRDGLSAGAGPDGSAPPTGELDGVTPTRRGRRGRGRAGVPA